MRLFFALLLLISFGFKANADIFLVGFEDIPIMDDAVQPENETFSFGNEESRYIETHIIPARGKTFNDVKNFYQKTLSQLGWIEQRQNNKSICFYREDDLLEIIKSAESPLKVSIILKNRN